VYVVFVRRLFEYVFVYLLLGVYFVCLVFLGVWIMYLLSEVCLYSSFGVGIIISA